MYNKESKKEYYLKNKDRINKRKKEYRLNNIEKAKANDMNENDFINICKKISLYRG